MSRSKEDIKWDMLGFGICAAVSGIIVFLLVYYSHLYTDESIYACFSISRIERCLNSKMYISIGIYGFLSFIKVTLIGFFIQSACLFLFYFLSYLLHPNQINKK